MAEYEGAVKAAGVSYVSPEQRMSLPGDGSMSYSGPNVTIKSTAPTATRETTVVEDVIHPFGPDKVPTEKPE